MKFINLTLSAAFIVACATLSMAQQTSKLEAKYDRFNDTTLVQLGTMKVTGGKYDGVEIYAMYKCQGNVKICNPEKVLIGLIVTLKETKYDLPGNLIVLADGERLRLGEMSNLGTTEDIPGWKIYSTNLTIVIPYDTFRKIAAAKKVEMKLDVIEFELSEDHRKLLQIFLSLMSP